MNNPHNVPASLRTLRLLEALAAEPGGMTSGQLAAALDIPHSALHALLNTLKKTGYIVQAGSRQPYHVGPRTQALGQPRLPGTNALMMAFYEETARRQPQETLALARLDDADMVILAEAPSAQAVRCAIPVGQRSAAIAHPAGWVLLAGLVETALERALASYPENAREPVERARRQTSACCIDEDVVTLAVPVCPDGQRPEAALLTSIPAFRWDAADEEALLGDLREMAARLSYRLGALTYTPYGAPALPPHGTSVAMPEAELRAFLDGPWAARLACIRPDGSPHVVPVWYEWRDATFFIAAWPGSLWADFVTQNPAVALSIDEPWPPMRRILVRGQAQPLLSASIPGGIAGLCTRIHARYLGAPPSGDVPPAAWKAFRIPPAKMIAQREQL
ncbi:MAG TPA: helix-turn-helix domain-containing protein [Anaerolineae bacterium]|nr:helix-turn-helix domain-containing protein [Anaerolineae bacterium]HQH37144.1 helix-turn-helix domain-containing protein [Anaerolineae bacterium]